MSDTELRIKCIELATNVDGTTYGDSLIDKAKEIYSFILDVKPQPTCMPAEEIHSFLANEKQTAPKTEAI